VITHGHSDHARGGSGVYYCADESLPILCHRLSKRAKILPIPYGEPFEMGDVQVSFHPAGHILGSAQVRIDDGREVWVVSGDYKRSADPTCAPFEVIPCDVFITESTFALPLYRWQPTPKVARDILAWWDGCVRRGETALLLGYSLGKSQRLLAELARLCDRPVYIHPSMETMMDVYRDYGVDMLETITLSGEESGLDLNGVMVLAPPNGMRSKWMWQFDRVSTGFASGWMRLKDNRVGQSYDRGFVLSDHADWPELVRTVQETGAKRIYTTHGYNDILARYLREQSYDAQCLETLNEWVFS
jgi:putative mRNA 3-end processing factor